MPRITFDGKTIDLLIGDNSLQVIPTAQFTQNQSGAGGFEQINDWQVEKYTFDAVYPSDIWRKMYSFFYGWSSQGKIWSFTMDTKKTVNTTLDGAAAADQKVVPLTATAGIKAGDELILKPAAGLFREAIQVAKITAGVSITAVDDLFFSYAAGDQCRHKEFFPEVKNTAKQFNYTQAGEVFYSTLEFVEAV